MKLYHGDKVTFPIMDNGRPSEATGYVERWANQHERTAEVKPDQLGTIPICESVYGGGIRWFAVASKCKLELRGRIGEAADRAGGTLVSR